MTKLKWERAKKWQPTEMMHEEGKVLSNGEVVAHQKDKLARRAAWAEKKWLKKLKRQKV